MMQLIEIVGGGIVLLAALLLVFEQRKLNKDRLILALVALLVCAFIFNTRILFEGAALAILLDLPLYILGGIFFASKKTFRKFLTDKKYLVAFFVVVLWPLCAGVVYCILAGMAAGH